tara:strand:- start:609 stop:1019 length:411 start_codon:yes stop_codon:yes gene_type:complete
VSRVTQLGIRNVSSSNREDYAAARAAGSKFFSVRDFRHMGTEGVLDEILDVPRYYVTIDIDWFDPSIAPGTGIPSHGGFLYYEVLETLQAFIDKCDIVGVDLVELAPDYDHSSVTAMLAAQLLMNFIGFIFEARQS